VEDAEMGILDRRLVTIPVKNSEEFELKVRIVQCIMPTG
jgi:hypothetical protein